MPHNKRRCLGSQKHIFSSGYSSSVAHKICLIYLTLQVFPLTAEILHMCLSLLTHSHPQTSMIFLILDRPSKWPWDFKNFSLDIHHKYGFRSWRKNHEENNAKAWRLTSWYGIKVLDHKSFETAVCRDPGIIAMCTPCNHIDHYIC
jgi:hypothetical protein